MCVRFSSEWALSAVETTQRSEGDRLDHRTSQQNGDGRASGEVVDQQ